MPKAKASDCCAPAPKDLVAHKRHVAAFKALAHPGRLQVFFHLVKANRALAAGEVQAALRLPAPTLSHHLDHLDRAGLITRRKDERFIYSEVKRDIVTELVRLLTACC
jgi:DNA-binding transcriptional ArsR family regulator